MNDFEGVVVEEPEQGEGGCYTEQDSCPQA